MNKTGHLIFNAQRGNQEEIEIPSNNLGGQGSKGGDAGEIVTGGPKKRARKRLKLPTRSGSLNCHLISASSSPYRKASVKHPGNDLSHYQTLTFCTPLHEGVINF